MAIFEYKCTVCGALKEEEAPVGQAEKEKVLPCATCGKDQTFKRVYAIAGIHFRGPGFYSTDSKADH